MFFISMTSQSAMSALIIIGTDLHSAALKLACLTKAKLDAMGVSVYYVGHERPYNNAVSASNVCSNFSLFLVLCM